MKNLNIVLLAVLLIFISYQPLLAEGRSGEQIYNAHCTTCHALGVANAPKFRDSAVWKSKNKTIDQFVESSKKGINAMPPMGTCMDCTDKEMKAAIEHMIGDGASKK